MTDRDKSLFSNGVVRVIERDGEQVIIEDRLGFVECDSVLSEIAFGLLGIPFDIHRAIVVVAREYHIGKSKLDPRPLLPAGSIGDDIRAALSQGGERGNSALFLFGFYAI